MLLAAAGWYYIYWTLGEKPVTPAIAGIIPVFAGVGMPGDMRYAQRTREHEHLTTISPLPLSLPLPLRCPCCCCYLRRRAADATAVSCANDAIIEGDNDDEGSAYNHRRRWSFKMSAKAASHLQIHLNSNFSRILSAPTPPRCCCTSK